MSKRRISTIRNRQRKENKSGTDSSTGAESNTSLAVHGMQIVNDASQRNIQAQNSTMNWSVFWNLFLNWIGGAIVILIALLIITKVRGTNNLCFDLIEQIDTLSLMFSLMLSAALEQLWNNRMESKYQLVKLAEIVMAVAGLLWYTLRAIGDIIAGQIENLNLGERTNLLPIENLVLDTNSLFWVNFVYIVIGTIIVIYGFVLRAREDIRK